MTISIPSTVLHSTQRRARTFRIDLVKSEKIEISKLRNVNKHFFRTCAWGQHRADNGEEKHDEEKPEDDAVEKEPEPIKEKGEDYDFIVSGAIGNSAQSPEVKVWRVESDRIKHIHNLTGHSLGIVSVDVSPNGKCKLDHP